MPQFSADFFTGLMEMQEKYHSQAGNARKFHEQRELLASSI